MFDIYINGILQRANFDVFQIVGRDVGVTQAFTIQTTRLSFLSITLLRIAGSPMVSAISIKGMGAGDRALGGGCGNSGDPTKNKNAGFDHRAHAVAAGPYSAFDFNDDGISKIQLDGSESHSHFFQAGPPPVPGSIKSYKWTWRYDVDGIKRSFVKHSSFARVWINFPYGTTKLNLQVVDNTGDIAEEQTTVRINSATRGGPYCYLYDFKTRGPRAFPSLNLNLRGAAKPVFGASFPNIDFESFDQFGAPTPLMSYAAQCFFAVIAPVEGNYRFTVEHNGAVKIFRRNTLILNNDNNGPTEVELKLQPGFNILQLHYFHPYAHPTLLKFSRKNGFLLSTNALRHELAMIRPIIMTLSKTAAPLTGGDVAVIEGTGFLNKPIVRFGTNKAEFAQLPTATRLVVKIPPATIPGNVHVMVVTRSGLSNSLSFRYTESPPLRQPIQFTERRLLDDTGNRLGLPLVAAVTYGPDGRLYTGSTIGTLNAIQIHYRSLRLISKCTVQLGPKRSVLGLAFSPFSNELKLYFTTSTIKWLSKGHLPFEEGWCNGKIESIDFSERFMEDNPERGELCAFNRTEIVTGLPVSNLDHSLNKLQFLPDGRLLVGVGGFTNGGISVPGVKPFPGSRPPDSLGGVASNPLSAAIVSCPSDRRTDIKYDNLADPQNAKIISGHACKLYATGFRNTFGLLLHSNGGLYATDNGGNPGFGNFSTDCNGGFIPSSRQFDKLYRVEEGGYHGHPNLNRGGRECVFFPPSAVQPIVGTLRSSTSGITEYRSNTFGGGLKTNIMLSKYAPKNNGQVSRVKLSDDGGLEPNGFTERFFPASAVTIVEGGRGELIMARVFQNEVVVLLPQYAAVKVTFMVGILPRQGPASGGTRVVITGHEFGAAPTARFGEKPCTDIVYLDRDRFSCLSPRGRAGAQIKVVVSGKTGDSPSYGSDFWYF